MYSESLGRTVATKELLSAKEAWGRQWKREWLALSLNNQFRLSLCPIPKLPVPPPAVV